MLRQLGDEPASLSQLALAIAGGDLNARFDPARPAIGVFGAMKSMVDTLKTKISEAEQKGREAEAESEKAQQATIEAEAARKQAERAKAEGMEQASSAVAELAQQSNILHNLINEMKTQG